MRPAPEYLRSIKRLVDLVVRRLLEQIFRRSHDQSAKSVLLVRTDGIGDFVYSVRYLEAIREKHKGDKLVLCCTNETAVLARSITLIDEVLGFDSLRCRRNYFYRYRLLKKIRSTGPTVAMYLSYHRENIGDEMTLFSGARETFAFSGNDECIHHSTRLRNNREFSCCVDVLDHIPERQKYAEMMKRIGCTTLDDGISISFERSFVLPSKSRDKAPQRTTNAPYAVLGPGGSGEIRRWPSDKFALLADRLSSESSLGIVLCGNRKEHQILFDIARAMKRPAEICSDYHLPEVVALIRDARAFVGNESGLLHVAASLNTPAIGILGGGHFNRYFPYGSAKIVHHSMECYECNWSCKYPEPYCITDISVDDVMKEFYSLRLETL